MDENQFSKLRVLPVENVADAERTIRPSTKTLWRPAFLKVLANTGNIRASCQAAGISRPEALRAYERSPKFRKEWDEAMEDAADALAALAWKRAREGSDPMLMFLLRAVRPETYRENYKAPWTGHLTISGPNGGPIKHAHEDEEERMGKIMQAMMEAGMIETPDQQIIDALPEEIEVLG